MRGELRAKMHAARSVLAALAMTAGVVGTLGCDSKSADFVRPSSIAFAALEVTLPEPAPFVGSFLSCTTPTRRLGRCCDGLCRRSRCGRLRVSGFLFSRLP